MKFKLITIGKPKTAHFAQAATDYIERLKHYVPFENVAVRDEALALKKIEAGDYLVVCDARGCGKTSEEMARFVGDHRMRGTKNIVFFIGGPDGIGVDMISRANMKLSLSQMTYPHELALVVLLEQLYRAFTIIKGEPYHK